MAVPSILLLTGVPPSEFGVGGVFLRELCRWYPHDAICCFHVDQLPAHTSSDLNWLPMQYVAAPPERDWPTHDHRFLRLMRHCRERYNEITAIPRLVNQAVAFGKQHHVGLVWAVLHSPTSVRMAKPVSDALRVPLVTTVWEPPDYTMRVYQVDRFVLTSLVAQFDETVRASVRCGVASHPMKHLYESKYGNSCFPLIYSPPQLDIATDSPNSATDRYTIGFAGGLYAKEEWQALLHALSSTDWRIGGKRVVLRVLGPEFKQASSCPVQIEYLGWHSPTDTLRLLSRMDAAYLPYWFAAALKEVVRLAFPNKLAAYVAARVPVFYHGPSQSSVTEFFGRFPVGICCHSLGTSDILSSLSTILMDHDFRRHAILACNAAYQQELCPRVFRARFAQLMGVKECELVAGQVM